jgi:uncharacterized repeat protein (TIGR01451 family)
VTDHGDYTCSHTTLNVVKTPNNGTFTQGGQVNYNIVVSNTGFSPAINAKLSDQLPTNGGLTWTSVTTSQGSCSISATYLLTCTFGNIPVGGSVTVTVSSPLTTPDAACTSQPNPIALATADNAANAQDAGSQSCIIVRSTPRLAVVKTPDGGTFTQGGPVSFTIVVSNGGQANSIARAVTLNDQLPTNGTLNWSSATVTTTQGTCSVNASSLLTCTLGDINGLASVTITVSLPSTPAAACQSQPNPHAIARSVPDNLIADDDGSLSCTPPGGLIAPTQTTCQDFASGTASTLGQINYPVSGGKIGQGINPGVFFYYAKVTVPANTAVTVVESQNNTAALFQIHQDQARLYKGDCSSWTAGTLIAGDTGASYTIATAGTYIISIKYDTKSIAGTTAPTSDPVTYTFKATPPGASSSASVLLKKQ